MSVQVKTSLPAVAFFAAALSLPLLAPSGAHAADTCLTAPKGPAPQGSHWYYRVERPSQRKCWRLVEKDRMSTWAGRLELRVKLIPSPRPCGTREGLSHAYFGAHDPTVHAGATDRLVAVAQLSDWQR